MTQPAYEVLNHPLLTRRPTNDTEWQEFIRMLLSGPLGKISDDGRIADDKALSQNVLGSRPSVQLVAALTAEDDAGTPKINITAHSVTFSFGVVNYDAATLTVSDFETTYYVYRNDPQFLGGAVEYLAFTTPEDGVNPDYGRVGQVATPTEGGAATTGGYGGSSGTGENSTDGNPYP